MKILPKTLSPYKKTPVFTELTIPKGLLKNHKTKESVWGLIKVQKGKLEYTIEDSEVVMLSSAQNGVVEPTVLHHVKPIGKVSFYVEFYK